MFKKLVTNLPFNSSLINQVGFYADRLRQEKSLRRLSFVFMALALSVQSLAILAPPERSLAFSTNHIINGVRTRDDILRAYDNNENGVRDIYDRFYISREDIKSLTYNPNATINSRDGGEEGYRTIGRTSLWSYSKVDATYKKRERKIDHASGSVYTRDLRAWDIQNPSNSYRAFKGKNSTTGQTYWILVDCGNITWVPPYDQPPAPTPTPVPDIPTPTIAAECSIIGPIVLPRGSNTVKIPVRIGLPANSSVPKGTPDNGTGNSRGLHLGVTTVGSPSTWNNHPANSPTITPPDKQSSYEPLKNDNTGVTGYDFTFSDGFNYKRYYVNKAHSSSFDVVINVKVNENDKKLAVRLIDREKSEWLPHSTACEIPITRQPDIAPEPKTPELDIKKTIVEDSSALKPGDTYTYRIQYRNKVIDSTAEDVVITDRLDIKNYSVVKITSPFETNQTALGFLTVDVGDLRGQSTYSQILIQVRLNNPLDRNTEVCNGSSMKASNAANISTKNDVCIDVITPCPFDPNVPNIDNPNCAEPVVVCRVVDAALNRATRKVTYKTTLTSSNPATTQVFGYNYNLGDGSPVVTNESSELTDTAMHTYQPGEYETVVGVTYSATGLDGKQETECRANVDFEDDEPLGQSKTVSNITRGLDGEEAIESTVRAGEVLQYTLATTNSQNYERTGIIIEDYIGDILDYATLNISALESSGGVFDPGQNKVIWNNITVPANSQVELTFEVILLDPIPATNRPSTTSGDYDCVIDNTYGNIVSMSVQCPAVKGLETLPNTGPGTSLMAVMGITLTIGYFFARARLMSKEIQIIRTDYAATGGM